MSARWGTLNMILSSTKPEICIAIPVWNREKLLHECLSSLSTNNIPMEVIVIDDRSTDNTREIAKSFGCKIIDGPGACNWRPGAIHWPVFQSWIITKAPYITYIFSDDLSEAPRLEAQLKTIRSGKWSAITAPTTVINTAGKTIREVNPPTVLQFGSIPHYCETLLIDRQKFTDVGGLDYPIHAALNAEAWIWAACGAAGDIASVSAKGFKFREHPTALSSNATPDTQFSKDMEKLTGWGPNDAIRIFERARPKFEELVRKANKQC